MEIDTLLSAFKDFEKKGKKETCPVLDQFLCHVAKTGETMIPWSQFKSYFLFKLEKVMDDFRASCPEQRGPANPNVEHIPFEEMKERILKIVNGYNGIPFTIQRLCELLTEPKRNYTGTDKFLRGVEKNVMVVSYVHPTSEKNGSSCVNRMNGVMFPGNSSAFVERNVNGPGTPRPLNRPKLTLSSSASTNGLPDSTENKDLASEQPEKITSGSPLSETDVSRESSLKNKRSEDLEETDRNDVKRLKFDKDGDVEDENEEEDDGKESPVLAESSSDIPESSSDVGEEAKDSKAAFDLGNDDHEPSSTQTEPLDDQGTGQEDSPSRSQFEENSPESKTSEQLAQPGQDTSAESQEVRESDAVSSSSSSSEDGGSTEKVVSACSSSSSSSPAEGSTENSSNSSETGEESMD
ncbi:serine/threonine-protein phosphatase 4 regulatory subunit 2-A [Chanos chanos]|uniref:Serine/threonine-protein phosphatase 4 regulatory subunit 2-A n=1 Tax=Chanos chanos TaxID=29144 RepID=A0A6J2UYM7_CHACN|nr:serine/threonine-protein phosphatase 4 regulatory subunit 2 [Chanos chanos]